MSLSRTSSACLMYICVCFYLSLCLMLFVTVFTDVFTWHHVYTVCIHVRVLVTAVSLVWMVKCVHWHACGTVFSDPWGTVQRTEDVRCCTSKTVRAPRRVAALCGVAGFKSSQVFLVNLQASGGFWALWCQQLHCADRPQRVEQGSKLRWYEPSLPSRSCSGSLGGRMGWSVHLAEERGRRGLPPAWAASEWDPAGLQTVPFYPYVPYVITINHDSFHLQKGLGQ